MPTDPWGGTVKGKKAGELVCTPASKLPQTFFSPSSRTIPATPTTAERLEARPGQDDDLPDPSYFERGLIYSAAGFEAIERGADPKVQPSWAQFHFAGKPHTQDTIAAFDGRDGRATLSHKIKKQIDPIPSSRGPLCTQSSRPGPDRPGYRGTAPPFRRTPPPSGPRIGGARRSAGNLFPGRICRWLRWPAGWTGLSRSERKKRRSTSTTGSRLQSCSTGKHRLVSDHTAATTQEPRTRQSGDGEGDGMNLSDEALV